MFMIISNINYTPAYFNMGVKCQILEKCFHTIIWVSQMIRTIIINILFIVNSRILVTHLILSVAVFISYLCHPPKKEFVLSIKNSLFIGIEMFDSLKVSNMFILATFDISFSDAAALWNLILFGGLWK